MRLKDAWCRVLAAATRLLANLDEAVEPVFALLSRADEAADRFMNMLLLFVRENVDRCDGLLDGIADLKRAGARDESIEGAISLLARQAEGPDGFVPTC
jgi:hypothetical protein